MRAAMRAPLRRVAPRSWLRLPRRTARIRLTALYGSLFLLSGVALVGITYILFEQATAYSTPPLPKVPQAPAMSDLIPLEKVQLQLGTDQRALSDPPRAIPGPGHTVHEVIVLPDQQVVNVQRQLVKDQHQLAQAEHQLAQSEHQLAQAGPVHAAQRAADAHQLLVNSGMALAIVAVLALLAGWFVAGRILRPIRTITRAARRISSASLHERLALDGPQDELKELGDTLDDLFVRLEAAFDAQRHFVANASHELRTPLTAERTLLQVALDDPGTSIAAWRSTAREVLASSDEQARLIEALLTLASSEGGLAGHEPLELAAIVRATHADLRPETARLGIDIEEVTAPAPLHGDPLLVGRLVGNLLTNAIRHNVAGGRVEVGTTVRDGAAVLSVTNTGPLIQPAEIDRLFQPFQRLGGRRANHKDGHGLGLSIVRAIARAHGAAITAEPGPGGGLSVRVTFPRPADLSQRSGASPRRSRASAKRGARMSRRTHVPPPAPTGRSVARGTPPGQRPAQRALPSSRARPFRPPGAAIGEKGAPDGDSRR